MVTSGLDEIFQMNVHSLSEAEVGAWSDCKHLVQEKSPEILGVPSQLLKIHYQATTQLIGKVGKCM